MRAKPKQQLKQLSIQDGEQRLPVPSSESKKVTRGQVLVTVGSLVPIGVVDLIARDGTTVFFSIFVLGGIGYFSGDIVEASDKLLDVLVPGRHPERVVASTERVVDAIRRPRPATMLQPYTDQSARARVMRMLQMDKWGIRLFQRPMLRERLGDPRPDDLYRDDPFAEDLGGGFSFNPALGTGREIFDYQDVDDDSLLFGRNWYIAANRILSGRKVLFGVSDAGKSNAVAVIAEEIGGPRLGAPFFLFDTEDEYRHLCDRKFLAAPLWMDKEHLPVEKAYHFAQWAVSHLRQVVINLQSYEDDEAAWLMIAIIQAVQDWEETHEVKLPGEIILDEASVWLPQVASQSTLSTIMVDDPRPQFVIGLEEDEEDEEDGGRRRRRKQISLLSLLKRSFFSVVVRRGRKRGMGFTLATQRIAEIDKSALQANWLFFMRQTNAADFQEYNKYGVEAKDALALPQGGVFVQAPGQPMEARRFRLRHSPHGADTPGLEELRHYRQALARQPEANDTLLGFGSAATLPDTNGGPVDIPLPITTEGLGSPLTRVSPRQGRDQRIISGAAALIRSGQATNQATVATALGIKSITAWTIRPYWERIKAEVKRLEEEEEAELEGQG